jgi:hypothetical protein
VKKKVRYAIGVLGAAPALALPYAQGTAMAAHVSDKSAKRVTLVAERDLVAPAVTCYHQADHSGRAYTAYASEYVDWDGADCVFAVKGAYESIGSGNAMRVRAYSHPNGNRVYSHVQSAVHGDSRGSRSWVLDLNRDVGQVCIAIVAESNHNRILSYGGPMCVTT